MVQSSWWEITFEALKKSWESIIRFFPNLIGAIIVFVIGWVIGEILKKILVGILKRLKIDKIFERSGWKEALDKAEIKTTVSEFFGEILKWIVVITFLIASVEILGFRTFADILGKIVSWLPNLIVAIIIFLVSVVVADILQKIIKASAKKLGVKMAAILGDIVKIGIYIFAVLAVLLQLQVMREIVSALVYGIIFAISLSLGLAFGLGGKEAAKELLDSIKKKLSEK